MLDDRWEYVIETINFAFQPIVNPYTGVVFGYEALLRNYQEAGFQSIEALFESAFNERVLYHLDLELRRQVFIKFSHVKNELNDKKCTFTDAIRLFYNIDNRILEMPEYKPGNTKNILNKLGLDQSVLCLEISEKHQIKSFSGLRNLLTIYKQQGYCVALDDFGVGYSGFELMYHSEPNFIKIDKHYIRDIAIDSKRRHYVTQMVRMAHTEGATVIAEGIENSDDLAIVCQIGCDYIQGFLVAKPTTKVAELEFLYELPTINQEIGEKLQSSDASLLLANLEYREPILNTALVKEILDRFKNNSDITSIPVVDKFSKPIGIIEERKMKKFVYSLYGKEIVQKHPLARYVSNVPIIDIHQSLNDITHSFASHEDIDGAIVVKNGEYAGYLSARLLLEVIHQKNIELAREENPLTKLPGNNSIEVYTNTLLSKENIVKVLIYIDLDNFKPFNDRFGFKVGDKAIHMLAHYLKEFSRKNTAFIGHIGGDDFFVGFEAENIIYANDYIDSLKEAVDSFVYSCRAFYDKDERKKGCYHAKDRFGENRVFSLLGASMAIVEIFTDKKITHDELSAIFSALKKEAKHSDSHIAKCSI